MPGPLRKRKRQPHEPVSSRKDDATTAASKAAATDEGEPSRDDPAQVRSELRGASPGEYRPL